MPRTKMVTLRMPRAAWHLLHETLTIDAYSGAFDRDLRYRIRRALEKVQEGPPRARRSPASSRTR